MKLKNKEKDSRTITDELGNQIFYFTGIHMSDMDKILHRVNTYDKNYRYLRDSIRDVLFDGDLSTADKLIEINNLL